MTASRLNSIAARVAFAIILAIVLGMALEIALAAALSGVEVACRPSVIRRAVANLVDNAVKYGGSARVNLRREAEHVAIVVDDDGPGIPVSEQEKVFAPFYRLEASRKPDKGGVGLGLSVARTIAREHGNVTLSNRDEGGLRVCMELPDVGQEAGGVTRSRHVDADSPQAT